MRKKIKIHLAGTLLTGVACLLYSALPVEAAVLTQMVTAKFEVLKNIVAAIISAIGVIVTLWGIFELGSAMQAQEGGAQVQAFKRIGGGLVMAIAPQLLTLLA